MRHLRSLKKLYAIDACIINGENSAEGNGITPESAQMLFDAGADVITTGNHVLKRREIYPLLEEEKGRADVLSEEEEQEQQTQDDEDEPKRFLGAAGRDGAVTVKTVVEDQVIEHEVINRETSLLAPGKTKLVQSGSAECVKNFLPLMDDLQRALEAIEKSNDLEALREGVKLIAQKFRETLKKQNVKEIEALGLELDTDHHEAVARFDAGKEKKGKIVDVVQPGYKMGDKVLRFAKVVVGE
mgnify:CR=1 FL=1